MLTPANKERWPGVVFYGDERVMRLALGIGTRPTQMLREARTEGQPIEIGAPEEGTEMAEGYRRWGSRCAGIRLRSSGTSSTSSRFEQLRICGCGG